jgi:hypothetical protein
VQNGLRPENGAVCARRAEDCSAKSSRRSLWQSSPDLPGDFNHDGIVDAADYVAWHAHFGEP